MSSIWRVIDQLISCWRVWYVKSLPVPLVLDKCHFQLNGIKWCSKLSLFQVNVVAFRASAFWNLNWFFTIPRWTCEFYLVWQHLCSENSSICGVKNPRVRGLHFSFHNFIAFPKNLVSTFTGVEIVQWGWVATEFKRSAKGTVYLKISIYKLFFWHVKNLTKVINCEVLEIF